MANIEVYPDAEGGWRFRIKANNNEKVASGESYATEAGALEGVEALKRALGLETVWGVRYDAYENVSNTISTGYTYIECVNQRAALRLLDLHKENDAEVEHFNKYPINNAVLIQRMAGDWEEVDGQ